MWKAQTQATIAQITAAVTMVGRSGLVRIRSLRDQPPRLDANGIALALGSVWVTMGGGEGPLRAGVPDFNPATAAPPITEPERVSDAIAPIKQQSADWNIFLDAAWVATFLQPDAATMTQPRPASASNALAPPNANAPAANAANPPSAANAPGANASGAAHAAPLPNASAAPNAARATNAGATPAAPAAATAPAANAPGAAATAAPPHAPGAAATAVPPNASSGHAGAASAAAPPGPPTPAAAAGVAPSNAPNAASSTAPAPPPTPRSLALPATASVSKVTRELEKEMLQLKGAREIDSGAPPQLATQQLLAQHPSAKLDDVSGQLTLPPLAQTALAGARSLQELSSLLMQQLGVSKVKFELIGKDLKVTVGINPQTYAADLSAPDAIGREKLQQMAAEARAICARNDAALKAAVMGANPASVGRVIVGSGFAAVANFITLPESERTNTIGVGFGDPWAARGDNLMGQTSEYLRVPGLPDPELFNTANAGGYIPSQAFADSTAMARAMSGMAVFPGWAGPVEQKADYGLEEQKVTAIDAAPQSAVQPGSAMAQADDKDKQVDPRIKPIANADEQMSQKGKPKGPVLVVGGGASAAWNVEKAKKDGAQRVDWLARPAPLTPPSDSDPKGELLFKASFGSASGGGQRNKLDPSTMFVGNLANSTVMPPPADPKQPAKPKMGAPGANPEPPQRDKDKSKREKWAAPAFAMRVPIQTDNGPILLYTNAVDVTNGPGPARNLNPNAEADKGRGLVEPTTNADGSKTPATLPPQINPASVEAAGMLVDPELAKVNVGVTPPPANRVAGGQPKTLPGGTYNQVVVSIGQDAKSYGSYTDLIADFKTDLEPMKIIWDQDLPDPKLWEDVHAVPLGVESKDKSLRILGAAATDGPGLSEVDQKLYVNARNAHLGRIGDPGARAEAGITRIGQTIAAANAQLGGGAPQAVPNAGAVKAPRPDPNAPEGDQGQQRTEPLPDDQGFVPPRR